MYYPHSYVHEPKESCNALRYGVYDDIAPLQKIALEESEHVEKMKPRLNRGEKKE